MSGNSDIGIICFAPELWDTYWSVRHHVMSRLGHHYKVLWVSPSLSWRQALNVGGADLSSRGVKKVTSSFWAYAPERYLFDVGRIKSLGEFLFTCRVIRIKSLLTAMGIKRVILYLWRPEFACYVGRFNEELTCYHVDDEYTFSEADLPNSEREEVLLKNSDIVFIHSKTLLEKKGRLNPETYYVPNGVDFNYYRTMVQTKIASPPEFASIPRPRIGYAGYIKEQLDLELLHKIAEKRKDWSFVLVGPINTGHQSIKKDIDILQSQNNVHFLGAKKPEDLPIYIKEMDVCLMNYRKTGYTKYIYPLKLHEYLSCGKPVVTTCLNNLQEFGEVLYFAEGLEDWINKIQNALNENGPELELRRIKVAEENSWDSRVKTIVSIFQAKLDRNKNTIGPTKTYHP